MPCWMAPYAAPLCRWSVIIDMKEIMVKQYQNNGKTMENIPVTRWLTNESAFAEINIRYITKQLN